MRGPIGSWLQTRCCMNLPGYLARLPEFSDLSEDIVFDYIGSFRRSAEIVPLDPPVIAQIRDVKDVVVHEG